MNKSELIKKMTERLDQLTSRDVDLAVHSIIEIMSDSLATGDRIEIRGFGTFSNHYRKFKKANKIFQPNLGSGQTRKIDLDFHYE